jgi:hypothetical protein
MKKGDTLFKEHADVSVLHAFIKLRVKYIYIEHSHPLQFRSETLLIKCDILSTTPIVSLEKVEQKVAL